MEFSLRGSVGKKVIDQELEAPSVEAAMEEARRRVEGYRRSSGGDGAVNVRLYRDLLLVPIWTASAYSVPSV